MQPIGESELFFLKTNAQHVLRFLVWSCL